MVLCPILLLNTGRVRQMQEEHLLSFDLTAKSEPLKTLSGLLRLAKLRLTDLLIATISILSLVPLYLDELFNP